MKRIFIVASLFVATTNFAQKKTPDNWQLLDPKTDHIYGMGVEEAYKRLQGRTPKTVIVAVIDSGTEIDHEDLKDVIWTNTGEIPNNGIDDDKNGYIDDVHGWSFLGGANGDIKDEALEIARIYNKMKKKFPSSDTTLLSARDKVAYKEFKKIKYDFLSEQMEQQQQVASLKAFSGFLEKVKKQNNSVLSKKALKDYKPLDPTEARIRKRIKLLFTLGLKPSELEEQLSESISSVEETLNNNSRNVDSIRRYIVGDDPDNMMERYYGCNRVEGPDAMHGTHVAGIIAATRNNNIGMDGVANNVKIMPIRAVPNGDERDKDIANAIYYAVDNGATVINMSFGKYYVLNKKIVDDAAQYAASKDVLIVCAAGNDAKNSDTDFSYPNRNFLSGNIANNWIQVGANEYKPGKKILAPFSNYGLRNVDLFAPGVDVYSTVPDNKYMKLSGTSMAGPATAGVAALIRGYFPELKANEVRDLLMRSVVTYKKSVIVPGTKKDKKKMSELCASGGFVNANNAVIELLAKTK